MLSVSPFIPLADKINCPKSVVVNAFMFGQAIIGLITPTGLLLMILNQLKYINCFTWVKFISFYMLILFFLSFIIIIINTYYMK